MIQKITKAYIRTYADNGQTTAYVEWSDGSRSEGRLPGMPCRCCGQPVNGEHMAALFARANREGITITRETWS